MNNSQVTKECRKCGETKGLDEFHKSARGAHGRKSFCKNCVAAQSRHRYSEKSEEIIEKVRAGRAKNPDGYRDYQRRYQKKLRQAGLK